MITRLFYDVAAMAERPVLLMITEGFGKQCSVELPSNIESELLELMLQSERKIKLFSLDEKTILKDKKMKFETKVIAILAEWLGKDKDDIKMESLIIDDLGADSLDIVELTMAFEEEFKIPEISDEQIAEWKTVQDAVDGLRKLSLDDETE